MPSLSIIIPAHNEAPRIRHVVSAALAVPRAEVIVIDDGSTDGTAAAAKAAGARVYSIRHAGKGTAMAAGIRASSGRVIVFIDADLAGITPRHIADLAGPVLHRQYHHVVGRLNNGVQPAFIALNVAGQRALTRPLAESAVRHGLAGSGYGAESLISSVSRRSGYRTKVIALLGVSNVQKVHKYGVIEGTIRGLAMPIDVVLYAIR